MSDVLLKARGLVAGYGEITVVRDLDLELRAGEVVALLGANGSGKSTTIMTLAGELPVLGGTVVWNGAETRAPLFRRARQGLGLVPEERAVLMSMTTRDNLRLGSGGVAGALAVFPELERLLDRRGGLLSGGEQQMLVLARALAARPRALLIDELSLGLAPLVVERLMAAVRAAVDEDGLGVVLVEQQARRAVTVADRFYFMKQGVITLEGRAEGALERIEAEYFGQEAAGVGGRVPAKR